MYLRLCSPQVWAQSDKTKSTIESALEKLMKRKEEEPFEMVTTKNHRTGRSEEERKSRGCAAMSSSSLQNTDYTDQSRRRR